MTAAVLPSAIGVFRKGLLADTRLVSVVSSRVSTRLPENRVYPALTINRIGGTPPVSEWLDGARVQVSAWSDDENEADLAARTAMAAAVSLENFHAPGEGWITGVTVVESLRWAPDDSARTKPVPRYIFTVMVYAHPETTA
jgi:hypothetical protein